MSNEEEAFKELLTSTIASIAEVTEDKGVGIIGIIEFELAVVTKKIAGGKLKLVLVEAGAGYQKEKISKIKFSIGSKQGIYRDFAWNIPKPEMK